MKKNSLTEDQLKRAFTAPPPHFSDALQGTLDALQKKQEEKVVKKRTYTALVAALLAMLLLTGVVYAMSTSPTADVFGWFYGEEFKQKLLAGDSAFVESSYTAGDVTFTLDEVVYADGILYGSGTIRVAEGKDAVLITDDFPLSDPVGYDVHYHMEVPVPEGTPTYAQLAQERGCKILLVRTMPDGYLINDELYYGDIGYATLPNLDGSFGFTFELFGGDGDIEKAESYTIQMYVDIVEVEDDGTEYGNMLYDSPHSLQTSEWLVDVKPVIQ